jgi:hypothetical protein
MRIRRLVPPIPCMGPVVAAPACAAVNRGDVSPSLAPDENRRAGPRGGDRAGVADGIRAIAFPQVAKIQRGRVFVALSAIAIACALSGCSTAQAVRVKPWERAYLADSMMDPGRDPLAAALAEHVYFSREAAQGGRGVGGAGCGCN